VRSILYLVRADSGVRPRPIANRLPVDSIFVRLIEMLHNLRAKPILHMRRRLLQPRHPVNHIDSQVEPVNLVENSQLQRRVDGVTTSDH